MSISNFLVKPAGPDCNLRCDYCFYLEKNENLYPDKSRMNFPTLENLISKTMSSGHPVTFTWQGGEPTLMGLDFFEKIVELQQKHGKNGQQVTNAIQTNGTLLNDKWAKFFLQYNFLVGLSLDGPKKLHNYYRKSSDGEGTWKKVMKASKILEKYKVPFNILSVMNDKTVKKPAEILDFFRSKGFEHLQFLPAVEVGENGKKMASFSPKPRDVGKFWDVIFKEWSDNFPPRFSVRYFESLLGIEMNQTISFCNIKEKCGSYFVVEHNGDVYPCDFSVEEKMKIGNIKEDFLQEIENREKFQKFVKTKKKDSSEKCKSCDFWKYCYGGCQRYRGLPGRDEKKTYLCEGYKYFLSRNLEKIKEIANKIRRNPFLGYGEVSSRF